MILLSLLIIQLFSKAPYVSEDYSDDTSNDKDGDSITSGLFNTLFDKLSNWFDILSQGLALVKNAIIDLGNTIINGIKNVFEYLFIPDDNTLFNDFTDLFNQKFGFVSQIIDIANELTSIKLGDSLPNFSVTLKSDFFGSLKGKSFQFIDFSMYEQYRTFIHSIIVVITDFFFFMYLLREIPCVVGGITTGTSMFRREDEVDYSLLGNRSNSYDYF